LTAIYGKNWGKSANIRFIASDGYKQIASISRMLKAARKSSGLIAYKETGKKAFSTFIKKGKKVNLGPYYLVWDRHQKNKKASHGDDLKWPYQLKTIEILSEKGFK